MSGFQVPGEQLVCLVVPWNVLEFARVDRCTPVILYQWPYAPRKPSKCYISDSVKAAEDEFRRQVKNHRFGAVNKVSRGIIRITERLPSNSHLKAAACIGSSSIIPASFSIIGERALPVVCNRCNTAPCIPGCGQHVRT